MEQLLEALSGAHNDPLDQSVVRRLHAALEDGASMLEVARSDARLLRKKRSRDIDEDEDELAHPLLSDAAREQLELSVTLMAESVRQATRAMTMLRDVRHEMATNSDERKSAKLRRTGRHCDHCPGRPGAPCSCTGECKRLGVSGCTEKTPSAA